MEIKEIKPLTRACYDRNHKECKRLGGITSNGRMESFYKELGKCSCRCHDAAQREVAALRQEVERLRARVEQEEGLRMGMLSALPSTYGDAVMAGLPMDAVAPHEWDNMLAREQIRWLVAEVAKQGRRIEAALRLADEWEADIREWEAVRAAGGIDEEARPILEGEQLTRGSK